MWVIIEDSTTKKAVYSVIDDAPRTEAGWRVVRCPISGFVPTWGTIDLTDIVYLHIWCSTWPNGGEQALYIDDLMVVEPIPGDLNGDQTVDMYDFAIMADYWLF
jgi:hypothetical protein